MNMFGFFFFQHKFKHLISILFIAECIKNYKIYFIKYLFCTSKHILS